jgi:hypothetical protein
MVLLRSRIRCENPPAQVEAFSLNCLSALSQASDGREFFGLLARFAGCGQLGKRFEFAEVGAVNAWKSVATYRINRVPLIDRDIEALCTQLYMNELARNEVHPKAIEFVYCGQLPHWFGFPISEQDPPYAIVRLRLEEALRAFTDWSDSDRRTRPSDVPLAP